MCFWYCFFLATLHVSLTFFLPSNTSCVFHFSSSQQHFMCLWLFFFPAKLHVSLTFVSSLTFFFPTTLHMSLPSNTSCVFLPRNTSWLCLWHFPSNTSCVYELLPSQQHLMCLPSQQRFVSFWTPLKFKHISMKWLCNKVSSAIGWYVLERVWLWLW